MNTFRGTGGQMSISLGSGGQMIRRSYDWRSNDPQPNKHHNSKVLDNLYKRHTFFGIYIVLKVI